MQNTFTFVAVSLLGIAAPATAALPFVNYKMQGPPPPVEPTYSIIKEFDQVDEEKTAIREVAPKPKEKRLICRGCNDNERTTLAFFQDHGIKDKNALATIMGNIKQESTFIPNICEGGSTMSYHSCNGGYGLIQWTSTNRYYGLGDFAKKYGGSPSSLLTQLRYLTNEVQWQSILHKMKTPGKSIDRYMDYTYNWIGWGYHGARTEYAYDYARRMVLTEI
jgi:hypothetical protein